MAPALRIAAAIEGFTPHEAPTGAHLRLAAPMRHDEAHALVWEHAPVWRPQAGAVFCVYCNQRFEPCMQARRGMRALVWLGCTVPQVHAFALKAALNAAMAAADADGDTR